MQHYLDAIIRLDEVQFKRFVDSGSGFPGNPIEDIIMSYGPLTQEILWGNGSGDDDKDEQLLREVDAKKARMIRLLTKAHFYIEASVFLRCFMMRCVEAARVLLEAGVNPNGYNYCANSTLWVMENSMRTGSHNPASWNIITELHQLLWEWGAVEFTFDHSCIYYDCAALQCCKEPFEVGETIHWPGIYYGYRDPLVRHYADFLEAPLNSDSEYLISGKITCIYAMAEPRYKNPYNKQEDNRVFYNIKETKVHWEHPTLDLCGYYVYLTDVEVDYNPDCKWPHNKRLSHVFEKRYGLNATQNL